MAQDEGPALYVAWEYEETNLLEFANYRCVYYVHCPPGTFLLNRFGQFHGCGANCEGSCARCSGSTVSGGGMSRCEHHHGEKCSPAINSTPAECGYKIKGQCNGISKGYSAPGGGCYCDIDPATPHGLEECKVYSCQTGQTHAP
jgi:hypothetical protein